MLKLVLLQCIFHSSGEGSHFLRPSLDSWCQRLHPEVHRGAGQDPGDPDPRPGDPLPEARQVLPLPGGELAAPPAAGPAPALADVPPQLQRGRRRRRQHPQQGPRRLPHRGLHGRQGQDLCQGSQKLEGCLQQTTSVNQVLTSLQPLPLHVRNIKGMGKLPVKTR